MCLLLVDRLLFGVSRDALISHRPSYTVSLTRAIGSAPLPASATAVYSRILRCVAAVAVGPLISKTACEIELKTGDRISISNKVISIILIPRVRQTSLTPYCGTL